MIYYIIFSLLTIAALLNIFQQTNRRGITKEIKITIGKKKLFSYGGEKIFSAFSLLLILFAACRWNVGLDFGTYQNSFEAIKSGGGESLADISFIIISKLLPSLTMVFAVYAFLSIIYSVSYIKNESPYIYLSLLLFYGLVFLRYDMGIMRQGLAMAITLCSIRYAREQNIFKFLSIIILAAFVHGSAICFVIVYFIVNRRFKIYTYFSVLIVCAVAGFTSLWKYLVIIVSYLPIPMIGKYMSHLANGEYLSYGFSFVELKDFALLILFLCYVPQISKTKDGEKYNALVNIFFIGVCVYFAFRPFVTISDRGAAYFCMTEILLIPMVIKWSKNKTIKLLMTILACVYSLRTVHIYCNYTSTSWMNSTYVPYRTFWCK